MAKMKSWSWWITYPINQELDYHLLYANSKEMVIAETGVSEKTHRVKRANWHLLKAIFSVIPPEETSTLKIATGPLKFVTYKMKVLIHPTNLQLT